MKLARIGAPGAEIPVVVAGDAVLDLSPVTRDVDAAFLRGGGPARAAAAVEAGDLRAVSVEGRRWGPPIARPGAVICIGMNYAAHARESGAEPPRWPVVFLKLPNTVVGPHDDVAIPRGSTKTDWEVELGVVLGARTSYLAGPDESLAHVAGFVTANDLSERAFQLEQSGGQWSKGKCCAGFTPLGPWLVTPEEFDHRDAALRSRVNGEPRQDSSTADMIFTVEQLVYELSQYMVLEPGDLVLTGTPQGVALSGRFPYLSAGDVCEIEVAGLGGQRTRLVAP